jgi:hypothetical protein
MLWRLPSTAAVIVVAGCMSTEERAPVVPSPASEPPAIAAPAAPAEPVRPSSSTTAVSKGFSWARSDGRLISGNAELTARARADLNDCKADAPPRVAAGAGGEACMRERGYYVRAID